MNEYKLSSEGCLNIMYSVCRPDISFSSHFIVRNICLVIVVLL